MPAKNKKDKLFISRVSLNGIKPFTQRPSGNKYADENPTDDLKASDLFSRVTADIIKEDTNFTR